MEPGYSSVYSINTRLRRSRGLKVAIVPVELPVLQRPGVKPVIINSQTFYIIEHE